jgi:RimJ/RimL family protein N-acetyltransferase
VCLDLAATQTLNQAPALHNIRTTNDALIDEPRALRDRPDPGQAMALPCGERVTLRAARPQDAGMIQDYIRSLSPASRRSRFLGALNELSANELYRMTHTDGCNYPAFIAEQVVQGDCTMIGEARYALAPDGLHCEFAVSVDDGRRRKTLGTLLIGIVASRARALGLRYLVGDVFRSNEAMLVLARKTGFEVVGSDADARLAKITKDLSLHDTSDVWNERASVRRCAGGLTGPLLLSLQS